MSIRMSIIGLVSSTVVAALVVAGGCGGDKKTEPLGEDGGTGNGVGGDSSLSGGASAAGGADSGYSTAGSGAYICRKGIVTAPEIAPGTNGVWGSSTVVTGGMFDSYAGTDMDKLVADTNSTQGSVTVSAEMQPGWYSGFGLYMKDPEKCWDASSYAGIRLTISGTAGPAMIYLQVQMNDNYPIDSANSKGACIGDWTTCTNNQFKLPAPAATPTAVDVPFASITGGNPKASLDPSQILGVQWQVNCPSSTDATATCAVNLTIGAVTFY